MRLATYNVENIFERARVLNLESWADGRPILEAYAELDGLMHQQIYDADMGRRMVELLKVLGLEKTRRSKYVALVEQRGQLAAATALRGLRIVAKGRDDWSGWLQLEIEPVPPASAFVAAQVVRDIGADVLALQEVESRRAVSVLTREIVPSIGGKSATEILHSSGNDDRGLGLGLATQQGYNIGWMRSHADVRDEAGQPLFGRDAVEASVWTPSGQVVWLILTQLKSRGYGAKDASDARRNRQATAIAASYARLTSEGAKLVAVCGDLNDTPDSEALAPLLRATDLQDVSAHPAFQTDGHVGTFGRATSKEKTDYLLLSPALFKKVNGGGAWRKGAWGPSKLPPWDIYPEMKSSYDAASDHAALWCSLDL
ncbi:MAG: endonuclease/exonuclease/phosphatase family protein [Hyphomicrobiaceae bacterium]